MTADPSRDYTSTRVVLLEESSAQEIRVNASRGIPFCEKIVKGPPTFVGAYDDIVLLGSELEQLRKCAPQVTRLPAADDHRNEFIYGTVVVVRTSEDGDVRDLTLEDYERLLER